MASKDSHSQFSGTMFKDALAFQSHLIETVLESRRTIAPPGEDEYAHTTVTYNDIDPSWLKDSENALERLMCFKTYHPSTRKLTIRRMSTFLHSSDQDWFAFAKEEWFANGDLTRAESRMLGVTSKAKFKFPDGPFAGVQKVPNLAIQLNLTGMPRLVFESGFSESHEQLLNDMTDWMVGGNGAVQAVILVKWRASRTTRRVRGEVELYTLDRAQMPRLTQREVIFPVPQQGDGGPQAIRLTRRMLFGGDIAPNRRPDDVLALDVQDLREIATKRMADMGYAPA